MFVTTPAFGPVSAFQSFPIKSNACIQKTTSVSLLIILVTPITKELEPVGYIDCQCLTQTYNTLYIQYRVNQLVTSDVNAFSSMLHGPSGQMNKVQLTSESAYVNIPNIYWYFLQFWKLLISIYHSVYIYLICVFIWWNPFPASMWARPVRLLSQVFITTLYLIFFLFALKQKLFTLVIFAFILHFPVGRPAAHWEFLNHF